MTASDVLSEAQRLGLVLEPAGDRLAVEGPDDVLTDALLERLRQHKAELLALLGAPAGPTDSELLAALPANDRAAAEADPALRAAYLDAVRTRRMRERGEVPPSYTATTECAGCGPVPIWLGCPARVLACPWCFVRVAGGRVPGVAPGSAA